MLLLDEPFGALDAFTREELWCILRDLWSAQRFNVILVTHDLREAVFLADTVYVMSRSPGRMLVRREIGLPGRARSRSRTRWSSPTPSTSCASTSARSASPSAAARPRRSRHDPARQGALGAGAAARRDAAALGGICRGFAVSEFIFPSPRGSPSSSGSSAARSPATPGARSG
jgi:hypothetical protein